MKWKGTSFFTVVVFFVLLVSFCGCSLMKRKTITKTRIEYKIDTTLHVRLDFKINYVSLELKNFLSGDTLKAENTTSKAVSYFNVTTQKVELKLTGKYFDVPVKINTIKTETKKETEKKGQPFYFWLLLGGFIIILLFMILKHFFK
jgi:hypothetical protein